MKLHKPYWIIACSLLIAGILFAVIGSAAGAWNQEKYAKALHVKDRYFEIKEPFISVQCMTDIADVQIIKNNTDLCTVSATNQPEDSITVSIQDDTLCITQMEKKNFWENWHYYFQFGPALPQQTITISLPDAIYETVMVDNEIGTITIDTLTADDISLQNDIGDIQLNTITCKNLDIENDIGKVKLDAVQVRKDMLLETNTGDMKLQDCNIYGTGNIKTDIGSLSLKESMLMRTTCECGTGDIRLSNCTLFDHCELQSDIGSIKGSICAEKDSCSIIADSDIGSVSINGQKGGYYIPNAMNIITIYTDTGSIDIELIETD